MLLTHWKLTIIINPNLDMDFPFQFTFLFPFIG